MLFVRYKGIPDLPSDRGKRFTPGKVYLARPDMDGSETVCLDWFEVTTDDGSKVRLKPDDGEFEFLEEVYAVVLRLPIFGSLPGEVVVLDDADDRLLSVKGKGLCQADNFLILDRTNVFPGLIVLDATGQWKKVMRVDECLWMMVDGSDTYQSPEDFRFAVSGNDILVEPIVQCIMADGEPHITKGKYYRLQWTKNMGMMVLHDDLGEIREFMSERFSQNPTPSVQ
jgi:hypothetical protein